MTGHSGFREALGRHLLAIEKRDLQGLADTVAHDGVTLITAEGRLVRETAAFLELHRGWFAMDNWTLEAKPVSFFESGDLGVAVMHLDYREKPDKRSLSYLTLVFERRGGRWVMVEDQNTPVRV